MRELQPVGISSFFTAISIVIFLGGCGNHQTKVANKAKADSIEAVQEWNRSIPGNFSERKIFHSDSLTLASFLEKYPALQALDTNITKFYASRQYATVWFDEKGLIEQAGNVVDRVSNLKDEGVLNETMYKKQLDSLLLENSHRDPGSEPDMELEFMLTAQYFVFAKTVWQGMDQSVSEASQWFLPRKKVSYASYLDSLLKYPSKNKDVIDEPVYRQYELLRTYLRKYRSLENEGDWPTLVLEGKSYKPGDSSLLIARIKKRLYRLDDFKGDTTSALYDDELLKAIEQFQSRLGLTVDGAIGKGTIAALNIPPEQRTRQLLVNMERARWLPVSLNDDYLAVNIPEFKLHVYHADSLLWSSNVVVGKELHKTVIFSGEIKYVVFSPYWNVPTSIVRNEIVPAMRKNKNYIRSHNMEITGYSGGLPIVRQKPGPTNSLGLVKFLFPNSHNIYLHDSPAKSLFTQSSRAYSHGCVRVSEPAKLAQFLLKGDSSWNEAAINKAMHLGKEKYVTLTKTVPVFITYFTAFVDRKGKINFREDVYDRDERLAKMILNEK